MTSKELALRLLGKPEKTISNILTGKSSITLELAEALSFVTGIPGRMWNSVQAKYNSYIATQGNSEALAAQWDNWGDALSLQGYGAPWMDRRPPKRWQRRNGTPASILLGYLPQFRIRAHIRGASSSIPYD